MSLKYAILGLLSLKPLTGYELKAHFDQSIRYLWKADQAQIYRTLSDISKEGLAVSHDIQQTGRPNKKVYELTPQGKEDLRQWLCLSLPPKDERNAELIQVFFSGQIPDDAVAANFKRMRDSLTENLSALSSLKTLSGLFSSEDTPSMRSRFFFFATLDLGIRTAKMNLEWIEGILASIEAGELPEKDNKIQ